jgi:hypothetical protein
MILTTYSIWFILCYLIPLIVFNKRTIISKDMINHTNLNLKAVFDGKKANVVSIDSDFASFLKNPLKKINENNHVVKMLRRMCDDAKAGVKLNPNVYILNYKNICKNFVFYIFFSAHIPFLVLYFIDPFNLPDLIGIQVVAYLLILLLKKGMDRKFSVFCKILYTYWYDKILNFGLIIINELKPSVLSALNSDINNNLLAAVKSYSYVDERRCDMLVNSTQELSSRLDELIKLQSRNESIMPESIITSLDNILEKVMSLNSLFNDTNDTINNSLASLITVSNKKKLDINAINHNTALLIKLKESLSSYKSEAFSSELAQLGKITSTLENDIGKTFTSIDMTIRKNTENLLLSYEKFFVICETFNNTVSVKNALEISKEQSKKMN